MDLSLILSAFSLVFLAEMGDKSQLLAMTLAHRYRATSVIAGTFLAFALLNLIAVFAGSLLFQWIPQDWVLIAAAALFAYFGYQAWKEADCDDEDGDCGEIRAKGGFLASFGLIFVAELGDKTQLAILALAAGTGQLWSVFIGGTLALWTVSLIGILFGATLLRRLPRAWVHRGAAVLFVGFAVIAVAQLVLGGSETEAKPENWLFAPTPIV